VTTERNCPLCGAREASVSRRFPPHAIVRCDVCRNAYVRVGDAASATVNVEYDEAAVRGYLDWYGRRGRRRERAYYESLLRPFAWPGARMIDVGAGLGGAVAVAQSLGMDACGVDPSPWADLAQRHLGLPVTRRRVEDVEDARFDVALTNATLEHVDDPVAFLSEIRRLLAPGGAILSLGVPNYRDWSIALGLSWFPNNLPPHHVNYFEPHSIRVAHERAGFEDVRVTSYGCDYPIQLAERMIASLRPRAAAATAAEAPALPADAWQRIDILAPHNAPRWSDRLSFAAYAALRPPGMGSMLRVVARKPV
jgi:SAM-dependent methyltransferase